jgi:hypothetical protein
VHTVICGVSLNEIQFPLDEVCLNNILHSIEIVILCLIIVRYWTKHLSKVFRGEEEDITCKTYWISMILQPARYDGGRGGMMNLSPLHTSVSPGSRPSWWMMFMRSTLDRLPLVAWKVFTLLKNTLYHSRLRFGSIDVWTDTWPNLRWVLHNSCLQISTPPGSFCGTRNVH